MIIVGKIFISQQENWQRIKSRAGLHLNWKTLSKVADASSEPRQKFMIELNAFNYFRKKASS